MYKISILLLIIISGCTTIQKPYKNYDIIDIKRNDLEKKIYNLEQGFQMKQSWNEAMK